MVRSNKKLGATPKMVENVFHSESEDGGEGRQSSTDAFSVGNLGNNFEHGLGLGNDAATGNIPPRAATKTTGLDTFPSADATSSHAHGPGTVVGVTEGIIQKAEPNDILLGRGRPFQNHSGNQAMRRLVVENKERYINLPRERRGDVANELLQMLETKGVRFLKRPKRNINDTDISGSSTSETVSGVSLSEDVNQGGWVLASKEEAYDKMCHALRAKEKTKTNANKNAEIRKDQVASARNLKDSSSVAASFSTQDSMTSSIGSDDHGRDNFDRASSDGRELAIQWALEKYLGKDDKSS